MERRAAGKEAEQCPAIEWVPLAKWTSELDG